MNPTNDKTVLYKNNLRRLTAVIGIALTLFGAVLLAIVAYAGWSANETAVARERQLVDNALDQAVSRVLNEEKAIAWWDDAVVNAQARPLDLEWIGANIGVYFYETYGHDEIYLVDSNDRPIYATREGELQTNPKQAYAERAQVLDHVVHGARGGRSELRARDGAFTADQQRYANLLGAADAGWSGHILMVDGAPAVVSAMAIVPSVDAGVLRGDPHLMVSVLRMDSDFMAAVGRTLLMPDLTLLASPSPVQGTVSKPLLADDGSAMGYLSWTPRRPGQSLLLFLLPLVALGVIGAGLLTWTMIQRLKRASAELAGREAHSRHQALHDALSGLPNRQHFTERLQEALDELVQTRNGGHLVVAYVDVDRFKDVNDTLGHQAGDALIMAVAERLRAVMAPGDFLARFGGDEFAVLHWASGKETADRLAERLASAFRRGFDLQGQSLRMTASIGMANAPEHGDTPQDLMRNADIALYRAKDSGRDRAACFSIDMAAEIEQRRQIEVDLIDAIERKELTLSYQPLVSSANNRITSAEALLRWRHPVRGDISPGVFVPIAEEAGLMPALGAFVLSRAFEEAKRWPSIEVSINLSPVQFRHMDLPGLLKQLLREHAVEARRFILEVTEGVLMESSDRNRQMLEEIRGLGFKVALDDFGTGYSSLRYLCDFRFDKIKIDRTFVTGIDARRRSMTIIQSVIALGRGLGMEVVAEGVETEAEAQAMRLVGATELQGFYFSRAVPATEFDGLLEASNAEAPKASSKPGEPARLALIR
jgi:diguanylate cyclase (GGDEF)-like protein